MVNAADSCQVLSMTAVLTRMCFMAGAGQALRHPHQAGGEGERRSRGCRAGREEEEQQEG